MAEDASHRHDPLKADEHKHGQEHERAAQESASLEQSLTSANESRYPLSLLSDPRLRQSANLPARVAVMRQAQQTYGNRALQRMLQAGPAVQLQAGAQAEEPQPDGLLPERNEEGFVEPGGADN